MTDHSGPYRQPGPKAYDRLDLTGVELHASIITSDRGRAAMARTATDLGYPQRTITSALTECGRIHVIQLGGDPDKGTVILLGTHGPITISLPGDARHRILPRTRIETLLDAVQADYPSTSITAALADALTGVLDLCDHHDRIAAPDIRWQAVEAVVTQPLRAHIEASDEAYTESTSTMTNSTGR